MPIIYGLAAMAAFAITNDQAGIDPQVDKQYAIVKQGEQTPVIPVAGQTTGLGFNAVKACPTDDPSNQPARTISGTYSQDTYRTVVNGQVATTGQGSNNAVTIEVQNGAKVAAPFGGATFTTAPSLAWAHESDSLRRLKGMDRKVSLQFTNASASDVLKWLSKQNVNFVANTDNLPKSKITVSLKDVPLSEALETVAESLGGAWQIKGSTLIFRTGLRSFMASPAIVPGGRAYNLNSNGFQGVPLGKGQTFKSFNWDPKAKEYKLDSKAFQNLKGFEGKTLDGKAFQNLKSLDGKLFESKGLTDMKGLKFNLDSKGMKAFDGVKFESLKPGTFAFGSTMGFKKVDGEKLIKSITDAQKDLMKKQGYLKVSDLTEAQKAMIFTDPKGELPKDFKFIIVIDDQKVTIQK